MTEQAQPNYLAMPASGSGPGVLVLHPWWGLNPFIRSFCDRLAGEGFVALAPDLYHGKIARTIPEAEQFSSEMERKQAGKDVYMAAEQLRNHPAVTGSGLGVVGFSLGASYALWLASALPQHLRAVTLFYGTGEGDFSQSQAAFQGHFAENDPYEEPQYIQQVETMLRTANRPVTFYTYPDSGHWFFESDRPDAYNPEAAQLAWQRTVEFLREQLK